MVSAVIRKQIEIGYLRKSLIVKLKKSLVRSSLKLNNRKPKVETDDNITRLQIEILEDWDNLTHEDKEEFLEELDQEAIEVAAKHKAEFEAFANKQKARLKKLIPGGSK